MNKSLFLLFGIFLFALIVRTVYLGSIPRGFTPDEASQAYSAYSLLKTGRDEWGKAWPVTSFKSFLDYKSPLQTYLMIPSISVFGLNEFATRLPSAIAGSLAILTIYFLVNHIFGLSFKEPLSIGIFNVGHVAALILAASPWHIQFSRMALEANLSSFLFPLGLLFFLKSQKNYKYYYFVAFAWGFCLYSYHAAKFFIPTFVLALLGIYYQSIRSNLIKILPSILLFILLTFPLLIGQLNQLDGSRASDLLISNLSLEQMNSVNDSIFYSPLYQLNYSLPKAFHNRVFYISNQFVTNYLSYWSPNFWFLEGGREITYSVIPGRGLLLLFLLPFFVFGLFKIFTSSINYKTKLLFAAWLFLAPLPAALTKEGYRPNRAASFAILLESISAIGVWLFLQKDIFQQKIKILLFSFVFALSFFYYLEDYTFGSFVKYPESMSFGWRDTIKYLNQVKSRYSKVVVQQGNQSQSMIAFYQQVPPEVFQNESNNWSKRITQNQDIKYLDQLSNYQLEDYQFKAFGWPEDKNNTTVYVAHDLRQLPSERRTLFQVKQGQKTLMEVFDFQYKNEE